MQISCVVVCYDQATTIGDAVLSLIRQTRPPDEILVADDASTDESRKVIQALAAAHPVVTPILRERNLGVAANRDLAIRQSSCDFVTALDGDDYALPTKLERECQAIERTSCSVAYSVQRFFHETKRTSWVANLPPLDELDARERLRWLVSRRTHAPLGMLLRKDLHVRIGGYRHNLAVYEDWDYKIRLAASRNTWANSGVEGVVVRVHGGSREGLSGMPQYRHALNQLAVMRTNKDLICGELGEVFYYRVIGRILAKSAKWQAAAWYWWSQETLTGRHASGSNQRD